MMVRHCVAVVLLLLAQVSGLDKGPSNPGFVIRITKKGLEYVHRQAIDTLTKEMCTIRLPDFKGSFKISWATWVDYDFHSLKVNCFKCRKSDLHLLPKQEIRISLYDSYMTLGGNWMVKKMFATLRGTFDLKLDGISISVSLKLGKDQYGRPTVSMAQCNTSISYVNIDVSGSLSWLLNFFHERIKDRIKVTVKQKICEMIKKSTTSRLEPYLQTLPVILMIDQIAGIDYRLVEAPHVTSESLDTLFMGKFFSQSKPSLFPFNIPAMMLPQKHNHMVYFAVSDSVFNMACRVYHQTKPMTPLVGNKQVKIPVKLNLRPSCLTSVSTSLSPVMSCFSNDFLFLLLQKSLNVPIQMSTNTFQVLFPQLARSYPNMKIYFEVSPKSKMALRSTPKDVILMPEMYIQAFSFWPSLSDHQPLFQLWAKTNLSVAIGVHSSRIVGLLNTRSKLKLELKNSNVNDINMDLLETIFNHYALSTIYPAFQAKLEEGFRLPLPRNISFDRVDLQIHKGFLLLGANIS